MKLALIASVFLSFATLAVTANSKVMICYFGSWATYRPGAGKFDVENIDPALCTHLIYGFAGLSSEGTIESLDPYNDLYDDYGKGAFERFTGLKSQYPDLKTMIAIGGWNEGSTKYSEMASSEASRANFIQSVVEFLPTYGFDGLDMDWEYPANRGGAADDKQNYVLLLQELKAALEPNGWLLTAAVSAGDTTMDTAYDVPGMNQYLDYINVMCYDYHGSWETFTGCNAPMYAQTCDTGAMLAFNVNYSINYWISLGATPSKIVLGMPLYGRGWDLDDPNSHGICANAQQPIRAGPYTREAGFWGYNEICQIQIDYPGWTVTWDDNCQEPYEYMDRYWMGYDDEQSLTVKTNYALQMGLAGAMVWSVDTDDFSGYCGTGTYPLLNSIVAALGNTVPTAGPTQPPPTLPSGQTVPPTQPTQGPLSTPDPAGVCTQAGLVPDPDNCQLFYDCVPNGDTWTIIPYECSDGTVFNPATETCDWPDDVPSCSSGKRK